MSRLNLSAIVLATLVASAAVGHNQGLAQGVRSVWPNAEDGSTISPDGKLVAFIDWSSGDVAVRNLVTGTAVRLTNRGIFAGSVGFPEPNLLFSPDGSSVVYPFGNPQAGAPFRYELRLTGINDTIQEVLAEYPPDVEFVAPLDWHSEDGLLFTTVAGDGSNDLLIMQPNGRKVRLLERRPAGSGIVYRALFSPDRKSVIYVANGRLHRVSSGGGVGRPLGIDAEALLGFSNDGTKLLFHGKRGDITGNWAIAISEEKIVGEPLLVERTRSGVLAAGQSVDGVAYLEPAAVPELFVVTLDIGGGRVLRAPESIALPANSVPGNPAWSPDGSRLAFTLRDPNRVTHRVMISDGLHGARRELARVDLRVMGLAWSADGRFLIVGGRADTRPLSWLGRIDVLTGVVEKLVEVPVNALASGTDQQVAYVRAAPAGERTVRVTVLTRPGAEARVLTMYVASELPRSMSVSPDGRWIALVKSVDGGAASALLLLPMAGGEPRTLLRLERPDLFELNVGSLPWTPNGASVLAAMRFQGQRQLGAVNMLSGEVKRIPFSPRRGGRWQPALHPDGRQLVYVDGAESSELKVMIDTMRAGQSRRLPRPD